MRQLLSNRSFILYWLVGITSILASLALEFVVSLYAYDLTGSPLLFGAILSAVLVPRLILTPISGVIADRYPRKRIMLISLAFYILLLLSATLYQLSTSALGVIPLFALVLLIEMASILFSSANAAVLPMIVAPELLGQANSFCSIYNELSYVLGPLIGGLVYGFFGFSASLILITVCAGISFVLLRLLPFPAQVPQGISARPRVLLDLKQGLSVIAKNKLLVYLVLVAPFLLNFFNVPVFDMVLVFYVRGTLGISPAGFSLFMALLAAAGVICAALAGKVYSDRRAVRFVSVMPVLVIGSMAVVLFSILATRLAAPALLLTMSFLACSVISATVGLFGIAQNTITQKTVSLDTLSRVMSFKRLSGLTAVPLGNLVFGLIIQYTSLEVSVLVSIGGIAALFVVGRALSAQTG
ncbi:MAG: MFS transporter [Coriobacteriales bacterium]|nr:MFS transporter [Coriobacteriales bacterium]